MNTISEIASMIEQQGTTWNESFAEVKRQMRDLELKVGRAPLHGLLGGSSTTGTPGEINALATAAKALLAGDQVKANAAFREVKGMSAGSDPDGGYVVLPQFSDVQTRIMGEYSPIGRLARTVNLDHGLTFEEVIDRDQAEANWVSETQARSDTAAPALGLFRVECNELCAMPKASQSVIDGASIDIVRWLTTKVAESFAVTEGAAFVSGNGVGKPRGILDYSTATTADATRTWGTLQHVITGASGAFATASTSVNPADCLVDVVGALKAQYRSGAVWTMNRTTAAACRKLKDADGRHVWSDSLLIGQPAVLLGFPVELDESMPDISAGSYSIAFGNFQRAYTIVRRLGTRFLVDPYSDKPNVRLYAFSRVGAGLNNSEALKLLKFTN